MTRTPKQQKKRLAELRRQWKSWRSGQAIADWWGVPWCSHRSAVPGCEGCATRAYCRVGAAEIEAEAAKLQSPPGLAEGELLALRNGKWVTV